MTFLINFVKIDYILGVNIILGIPDLVNNLIKKYKTNNPMELCDYLGIKVIYEDLGSIHGFYQYAPKNKIIHLNVKLNETDMLFTCAHELGHAILHSNLNILFLENKTAQVKGKYEIQADQFAAELLIDNSMILNYEGLSINTIAKCENIDVKFLKHKFLYD